MSDERHEGERAFDLLDRIDLLIATLPPGDAMRRELLGLRMEISQREEIFVEARQTIEKLEEVIKKVTSPANRIGTFLGNVGRDTAHIVVGGADYYCNVDPRISLARLQKGARVLVNEAYVRLIDWKNVQWQNRSHFYAIAAQMMRRILVDRARMRKRAKRGGGALPVSLSQPTLIAPEPSFDLVAFDEALEELAGLDQRKAKIVELRFFGGLSVDETAEFLDVSAVTVMRDWRTAKAWLHKALES